MGKGERAYGFGLSREGHIAFAAAYVAVLVTIGAVGFLRYAPRLAALPALVPHTATAPVAYRAHPMPDPASPHVIRNYPRVALLRRQEGTVVVRLLVLKNGEVGDVALVKSSGYPLLDAAALVETGDWRYLPAVRNGVPMNAVVDVAIHFKLSA
jgi:periplasmic protein TonB